MPALLLWKGPHDLAFPPHASARPHFIREVRTGLSQESGQSLTYSVRIIGWFGRYSCFGRTPPVRCADAYFVPGRDACLANSTRNLSRFLRGAPTFRRSESRFRVLGDRLRWARCDKMIAARYKVRLDHLAKTRRHGLGCLNERCPWFKGAIVWKVSAAISRCSDQPIGGQSFALPGGKTSCQNGGGLHVTMSHP
jgi:hypothetical protein